MQEEGRRSYGGSSLVIPALLLVTAFLMAPLALVFRYSLDRFDPAEPGASLHLHWQAADCVLVD